MAKQYPAPICWEMVADVLITERGQSVDVYKTVSSSVRSIASALRLTLHKGAHGFARVSEPADFTVVLMGRNATVGLHHVGLYYQGKVLHALDSGTVYQDMASLQSEYQLMEFWSRDA